eukprot:13945922-Alexandrium_andersonii.AAC.1
MRPVGGRGNPGAAAAMHTGGGQASSAPRGANQPHSRRERPRSRRPAAVAVRAHLQRPASAAAEATASNR